MTAPPGCDWRKFSRRRQWACFYSWECYQSTNATEGPLDVFGPLFCSGPPKSWRGIKIVGIWGGVENGSGIIVPSLVIDHRAILGNQSPAPRSPPQDGRGPGHRSTHGEGTWFHLGLGNLCADLVNGNITVLPQLNDVWPRTVGLHGNH